MNRELASNALRAQLLGLVVATTGVMSLSATSTGYARTSGSFIDENFAIGMEVLPVGFPQTVPGVIAGFTATTLTIKGGRIPAVASGPRALVAQLPSMRAWSNNADGSPFKELAGVPFVEDEFTTTTRGRDAIGNGAEEDDVGFYYVRPYCLAGVGDAALYRITDAILNLYPIGRAFTLTDGSVLRIRGYDVGRDVAPTASGILPYLTGWRVAPISIPWRVTSTPV